MEKGKKRIIL